MKADTIDTLLDLARSERHSEKHRDFGGISESSCKRFYEDKEERLAEWDKVISEAQVAYDLARLEESKDEE